VAGGVAAGVATIRAGGLRGPAPRRTRS